MNFISFPEAFDFWIDGGGRNYPEQPYTYENFIGGPASGARKPSPGTPAHATGEPVHATGGPASGARKPFPGTPAHLPEKSYARISEETAVLCPEACFVLAGLFCDFEQLVELGNILCGAYVYDASLPYKQRARKPVTTAARIQAFAANAAGMHGVKKAKTAARYVVDGSGSVMESRILALFHLPQSRGGFGLTGGVAGGRIRLSAVVVD